MRPHTGTPGLLGHSEVGAATGPPALGTRNREGLQQTLQRAGSLGARGRGLSFELRGKEVCPNMNRDRQRLQVPMGDALQGWPKSLSSCSLGTQVRKQPCLNGQMGLPSRGEWGQWHGWTGAENGGHWEGTGDSQLLCQPKNL